MLQPMSGHSEHYIHRYFTPPLAISNLQQSTKLNDSDVVTIADKEAKASMFKLRYELNRVFSSLYQNYNYITKRLSKATETFQIPSG